MVEYIKVPPSLKPGDAIGMMCPAGFMPPANWGDAVKKLEEWGLKVKLGKTMNSSSLNYFSGTDAERRADLQEMLDDPELKAILFGRGGYGLGRIIDHLDFNRFMRAPKWLVGFSDITVLHSHLLSVFNTATIHGPMAAAFTGDKANSFSIRTLKQALFAEHYEYGVVPHVYNIPGYASGVLTGGNLALLTHVMGTKSDMDWKGKILFMEDVGEYTYSIDRMMIQLLRSGKLSTLSGLIIGGFTDVKDTVRPFGQEVYDLIREKVNHFGYPVCYGFPVSHGEENYALKCGLEHELFVAQDQVVLRM